MQRDLGANEERARQVRHLVERGDLVLTPLEPCARSQRPALSSSMLRSPSAVLPAARPAESTRPRGRRAARAPIEATDQGEQGNKDKGRQQKALPRPGQEMRELRARMRPVASSQPRPTRVPARPARWRRAGRLRSEPARAPPANRRARSRHRAAPPGPATRVLALLRPHVLRIGDRCKPLVGAARKAGA